MSRLVSIDPGVNGCGVALFDDYRLVNAAYVAVDQTRSLRLLVAPEWAGFCPERVILEMPRIYPSAQQKGDQNDLMELARVVGRLEEHSRIAGCLVERIYPRNWKGTLDADEMVKRIQGRLAPGETSEVRLPSAQSLHHNVWDGVGIGLHALGRLEPKRVFPR